ncbi:MAG: hypothetical protein NTX49_10240 [Chlamydiae bacterium]|nr:hypothetical protein [Chlamydiota bacterium]
MKNKKLVFIMSGLIAAFGLFTPWDSYRTSNLPTVATMNAEETFLRADTLHVIAKAYTSEESKKYLRKDLLRKGYQPVQITIQNNSAEEFSLSSGSVDLPTADPSKIAHKLLHSAIPRSIALRVASLFFWPFAIPSTIDSMITLKSYKTIKNDLQSKLVKKEVIAPYSIYNRIVFVPIAEFKGSFDVTLIELHSLKPKVVHISGLEMGKTIETTSDVDALEPAAHAPLESSPEETTQNS